MAVESNGPDNVAYGIASQSDEKKRKMWSTDSAKYSDK